VNVQYEIDDSTGVVSVTEFVEEDDTQKRAPIEANAYVRVYGSIRVFQGKMGISCFKIQVRLVCFF
jgi:hypothetical protein